MTQERFYFTGNDGEQYSLPKSVPSGALRKMRNLDYMDGIFTLLEECADPATLAALDALEIPDLGKVAKDWMQGLTTGKWGSSSTSSTESTDPA